MRFRAEMSDGFCIRRFALSLTTLLKLGEQCMVFLSPKHLCFVIFEPGLPKNPLAWCNLQQNLYFDVYKMEGIQKEFNQIALSFSTDLFSKVIAPLRNPHSVNCVKIKLSQKKTPCLVFEIESTTLLQCSRTCTYDVPVSVVPQRVWINLGLTNTMKFDLSIHMPNIKQLKTACDKLKNLANQVSIEGTLDGHLAFKIVKDNADIGVYFNKLMVETCSSTDPDRWFTVKADFKKLTRFLSIEAVGPRKVICNIIDTKLVFMHVIHDNVTFDFFIAGIEE